MFGSSKDAPKPAVPQRFPPPGPATVALIAHYGTDGEEKVSREFNSLEEAKFLFSKMVDFAERTKRRQSSSSASSGDAIVMYTRRSRHAVTWEFAARHGEGLDLEHLVRWVSLRRLRVFESLKGRLIARLIGAVVRSLLWLGVQRHGPTLRKTSSGENKAGLWPAWVVKLLNLGLEALWPSLRVTINEAVEHSVPPIANAFIGRMQRKPIDKITSLAFDIGDQTPRITSLALNPSFSGYEYLDLDLGIHIPGDAVRLNIDVNLGGDEAPDVTGRISRCDLKGKLRLKLGPLIGPLPCFGFIQLGFTEKPILVLDTEFKLHESVGLPVGISLESIDLFIQRLIENLLENVLSWPKSVTVPLATFTLGENYADSLKTASTAPIGALRLEVLRCESLLNNDVAGMSDPYVVCSLGQREERTTVLDDTCDPEWAHPRTFIFDVHESTQTCTLQVYDSEVDNLSAFNDALLGVARLNLGDLNVTTDGGKRAAPTEMTLPMDLSGYDGKLKNYHSMRQPPQSTVTVLARFALANDAERERTKPHSMLPLLVAGAVAGVVAIAIAQFVIDSPIATFAAQAIALGTAVWTAALAVFIVVLGLIL